MNTRAKWAVVGGLVTVTLLLVLGAGTVNENGIYQGIQLGGTTNVLSDNGSYPTYNGTNIPVAANWVASGTTNSTLAGTAYVNSIVVSNTAVVNVKNPPYNAVGDGTTDDTVSVSNALKNANVFFPPGRYSVTGPLYPTNGLIYGIKGASTIVLRNPGAGVTVIDTGTYHCNTSILGLSIDGGTNSNFNSSGGGTLGTLGVLHWEGEGTTVSDCEVSGLSYGVKVTGTNSISGRNCQSIYTRNYITNCFAAIYLSETNQAEYASVTDNLLAQNYVAFYNRCAANILFVGNSSHDCSVGIDVITPPTYRGHSLYTGNIINHCSSYAVYFNGVMNAKVSDNEFLGSYQIGLASATNCIITGNHFELSGSPSLVFTGGLSNNISGNYFITTSPTVTGATSSNVIFSDNWYSGQHVLSETSGLASVSTTNTSVNVLHGLPFTPSANQLVVVPNSSLGSASQFWISSVTSSNFTISLNAAPTSLDANFSWRHIP